MNLNYRIKETINYCIIKTTFESPDLQHQEVSYESCRSPKVGILTNNCLRNGHIE